MCKEHANGSSRREWKPTQMEGGLLLSSACLICIYRNLPRGEGKKIGKGYFRVVWRRKYIKRKIRPPSSPARRVIQFELRPPDDAHVTRKSSLPNVSSAVTGTAVSRMAVVRTRPFAGVRRISGMSSAGGGRVIGDGDRGRCRCRRCRRRGVVSRGDGNGGDGRGRDGGRVVMYRRRRYCRVASVFVFRRRMVVVRLIQFGRGVVFL